MLKREISDKVMYLYMEDYLVANKVKDLIPETKEILSSNINFEEVILDIKNVRIIDSIGISFIIGLFKTSKNNQKRFSVTGTNKDIKQLFELMKLNSLFQF